VRGVEEMASSYSPVVATGAGRVRVELAADHPGATDPVYRARRDELAALASAWSPGQAVPEPVYTDAEHHVWATVSGELARRHADTATRRYLDGAARLGLPTDHVPQLTEVTAGLAGLTGFSYLPVAGLAPLRTFYRDFAAGRFWSTQYVRHPAAPLYTPEPDIIHEVIGHANQVADPEVAAVYRLVGAAVERCVGDEALWALSRIFWFTFEFGVVREAGRTCAFGAGLLSSVGELDEFRGATIVPADLAAMATVDYDISRFQPVLFSYPSDTALLDEMAGLFSTFDDDAAARLAKAA
jgi:phenylalanine-4-hydroxylase